MKTSTVITFLTKTISYRKHPFESLEKQSGLETDALFTCPPVSLASNAVPAVQQVLNTRPRKEEMNQQGESY